MNRMDHGQTYVTRERYNEIVAELAQLKSEGRHDIAERLKQAKELGDLSENSEYQEAREEQTRLEQQIAALEELLRHSAIIKKPGGTASVTIGSKVKLQKHHEIISYTIVGSNEAQPANGFISNESPIGKGLLGKKVGDELRVKTPKGEVICQVLDIQ